MRKLLITLLFIVLMIPTLAQEEDEPAITVPDLAGLTVPEAARVLYEQAMLLDPIIESLDFDEVGGAVNTIGTQSPEAGTKVEPGTEVTVTVSVIRSANLLLLYEPIENVEAVITFYNLSEEVIDLTGVVFESDNNRFEARDFRGRELPSEDCFQAWGKSIGPNEFYTHPQCGKLLDYGLRGDVPKFWQDTDTFTVMQDGIYRGTCEVAAERCEVWVSPNMIAEDVTEYAYFVYDEDELYVYNRSDTQWMPLYQMRLDAHDDPLNDENIWSNTESNNIDFLIPGQCVIFADGNSDQSLLDCNIIARKNVLPDRIFWQDGFTFISLHRDGEKHECPAPSGRTICLVPRNE